MAKVVEQFKDWKYEVPQGWVALCEELAEKLDKILEALSEEEKENYELLQVKEKFGSLRWYDNWHNEEMHQLIRQYEYKTERTCCVCGKMATKITLGWVTPFCDECIPEGKTVGIDEFYESE
jgi:hypothetical protein